MFMCIQTTATATTMTTTTTTLGVGEQRRQGRPKWISVRQNGLAYTVNLIDSIIFIKKVIKS